MTKLFTLSKRTKISVFSVVMALIGAGVAWAYWVGTGGGTGSATTATPAALTVNQTSTISDLAPGNGTQTLSGDFDNPNDGPIYVTAVTVAISGVAKAGGAPAGTCDATDYTLTDATMSVGAQVPAGSAKGSWSGAKIEFNNKNANQNACQGATVSFSYTIS